MLLLGAGPSHRRLLQAWALRPPAGVQALWLPAPGTAPLPAAAGVQVVQGQPQALDLAARQVLLADGRRAEYDWLSLDLPPATPRDSLPGARGQALFVQPAEAYEPLLPELLALAARREIDIVAIGAGPLAAQTVLALQQRLARGGGHAPQARLAWVLEGAWALPGWPAAAEQRLRALLRRHRVAVIPGHATAVAEGAVQLAGGARLACDAPVLASAALPPPWLRSSGLALDEQGQPARGATLQSPSHPTVLLASEMSGLSNPPAHLLAHNLQRLATGRAPRRWRPAPWRCLPTGDGGLLWAWRRWALLIPWAGRQ